jgi:hypothetical protein
VLVSDSDDEVVFIPDTPKLVSDNEDEVVPSMELVWESIKKRKTPDNDCSIRRVMKGLDYEFCNELDTSNVSKKKFCKCGNGDYVMFIPDSEYVNDYYVCNCCRYGKRKRSRINYAE